MNVVVQETIASFDIDLYKPIKPRTLSLGEPLSPKAGNLVKVVTGMQRSGKSYRLFQEIERLLDSGIPQGRICYFNFEDDRLFPITPATGDDVLEAFETLNPGALSDGAYLFFDELQEMKNWGTWLRRITDTTKATIYVMGSSSKLLSSEIATEFRGRAIDFELLPLSFEEFLRFNGTVGKTDIAGFSKNEKLEVSNLCKVYLEQGGFPAVQGLPKQEYIPILQSYAQQVVARDVIERHNISRPRVATSFAQRVLGTNGRRLSIRKAANDLKSIGLTTNREALGDMLDYFEEAYLCFTVHNFTFSLSDSTTATPKIYAVDPGLALANSRAATNDEGQRLEDAIYLELRRRAIGSRKDAITSFRTKDHGYEIDFVSGDALDEVPLDLIQVCDSVEDETTLERELRALWEALEECDQDVGTLIVGDGDEREYERNGKTVLQVPAWKWLLS